MFKSNRLQRYEKNEIYSTHAHVNREFFIFLTLCSLFGEVHASCAFDVFFTPQEQKKCLFASSSMFFL